MESIPDSVRKRMFATTPHHANTAAAATTITSNYNNATAAAGGGGALAASSSVINTSYQSKEDTQNTSISSLSTQGEEDPRMPPVHTRLFSEDAEYAYSDDDDDVVIDDDHRVGEGGTRLNFNLFKSPQQAATTTTKTSVNSTQEKNGIQHTRSNTEESPFKDLGEAAEKGMFYSFETILLFSLQYGMSFVHVPLCFPNITPHASS